MAGYLGIVIIVYLFVQAKHTFITKFCNPKDRFENFRKSRVCNVSEDVDERKKNGS